MAQTYHVKLRVVEARQIQRPSDSSQHAMLPSPYVEVEVGDDVRQTDVVEESSSCVWNSTFLFGDLRLNPAQFSRLEACVRLRSANVLVRDDVLGSITLALAPIFNQSEARGHMRESWLAVPDPSAPERTVAYLLLEVWVGATGMTVESVSDAAESAAVARADAVAALDPSGALVPVGAPQVSRRLASLDVSLVRGEGLPAMTLLGTTGARCNPYCIVRHGHEFVKSSTLRGTQAPTWNEVLSVPCDIGSTSNSAGDRVQLEIWHSQGGLGPDIQVAVAQMSLVALAASPRPPHWINLYGPPCDVDLERSDYVGPGTAGAVVSAVVRMSPFSLEPGLPRATAYLGRILVGWDLVPSPRPRKAVSGFSDAGNAAPPCVPTLVTVRVLEARGLVEGYMRSARCIVSYGPHRRVSSWRSIAGGVAVFNFRPRKSIAARSMPVFDAASLDYLKWQAWDVLIAIYTFSPFEGVRQAGYARIPAERVMRTAGAPGYSLPVEARWFDARPAFKPLHVTLPAGTDSIAALESAGATGFFAGDGLAPGSACVRIYAQVCVTQSLASPHASAGVFDGVARDSDVVSAESSVGQARRPKRSPTLEGDGEDSEDQASPDVQRTIVEVGLSHPPTPLPLHGLLASSPLYAAGLDAAAILHGTSTIKSGPRYLAAAAVSAGVRSPGVAVPRRRDLMVVIYQARGLPVPPHTLLCHAHARRDRLEAERAESAAATAAFFADAPQAEKPAFGIGPAGVAPSPTHPSSLASGEGQRGLVVNVSSAVSAPHLSPACREVGPAPLWYHTLALPYTPLATTVDSTVLPPGLLFTVMLDGRAVAQTADGTLSSAFEVPQWVPLTAPADGTVDAGALLILCTFDEAILSQWRAFVGTDDDAAVLRAADDVFSGSGAALDARKDAVVNAAWSCAKAFGVSKDIALPLAWAAQPWLPSLKPYRVQLFAQGLRDLTLPTEDSGGASDFPAGVAAAEWRIELRVPDVADALLSSGAWHRHKQIGCKTSQPAARGNAASTATDALIDAIDLACLPESAATTADHVHRSNVVSHARYTPFPLPPPRGAERLDEASIAAGVRPRGAGSCQRSDSVSVDRSGVSIVLTGHGRMMNPQQAGGALPRDALRHLCLTNPQLLTSCESGYTVWLPSSPLFAPDAVVYVWRRPVGVTRVVVDDDAALSWDSLVQHGWQGKAGWVLVGTGVLPLQSVVAGLWESGVPAPHGPSLGLAPSKDGPGQLQQDLSMGLRESDRAGSAADEIPTNVSLGGGNTTNAAVSTTTAATPVPAVEPLAALFHRPHTATEWGLTNYRRIPAYDASIISYRGTRRGAQAAAGNTSSASVAAPPLMQPSGLTGGSPTSYDAFNTIEVDLVQAELAGALEDPETKAAAGIATDTGANFDAGGLGIDTSAVAETAAEWSLQSVARRARRAQADDGAGELRAPAAYSVALMTADEARVAEATSKSLPGQGVPAAAESSSFIYGATPSVYARYAAPLERCGWLNLPTARLPLYIPQAPRIESVLADAIAGRVVVWMDTEFKVQILQFQRTREGGMELVPAAEAPTQWQLVGHLVAAFGLTEEVLPPTIGGGAAFPRMPLRDRYDGLPSAVPPIPVPAEDLVSLTSPDETDARLAVGTASKATLPPWLSMQALFPAPSEGDPDAVAAAQAATALLRTAGAQAVGLLPAAFRHSWLRLRAPLWRCRASLALAPAFQQVQVRVVVYRAYHLEQLVFPPGGAAAPPPLRVRVLGTGVGDPGLPENGSGAVSAGAPYVWVQEGGMRLQPVAGARGASGGERSGGSDDTRVRIEGADAQGDARPVSLPDGTAEYQREFTLSAFIPGRCTLVVELMSQPNALTAVLQPRGGEPVGSIVLAATRIALEPRWNSRPWRELALHDELPVEIRRVWPPRSFAAFDPLDEGRLPTPLADDAGGGAQPPPHQHQLQQQHDLPVAASSRSSSSVGDVEALLRRTADPLGALELWVGMAPAGEPLPLPPPMARTSAAAVGEAWELRVVIWKLQQTEKGSRVPAFVSADLLRASAADAAAAAVGNPPEPAPAWLQWLGLAPAHEAAAAPSADESLVASEHRARTTRLRDSYATPTHPGRRGTGQGGRDLELHWRMRFRVSPLETGAAGGGAAVPPRLRLRAWRPMPWFSGADRVLSEALLDLQPLLARAAAAGTRRDAGTSWVELSAVATEYGTRGAVFVQVHLVPPDDARARPVGLGRAAPNRDPFLPEPHVPPQYSWWERLQRRLAGATCALLTLLLVLLLIGFLATRRA